MELYKYKGFSERTAWPIVSNISSLNRFQLFWLCTVLELTPFSCQSGISSFKARGSRHAPDSVCAPICKNIDKYDMQSKSKYVID